MDKFQVCGNYITRRGVTPDNEPKSVNTSKIKKMLIDNKKLFCRYTSCFDISPHTHATEYWYCIKDTPISLDCLTSKQRYRVNKGIKLNEIKLATRDDIVSVLDDLANLTKDCFCEYPLKYRPTFNKDKFMEEIMRYTDLDDYDYWLCFDRLTNKLSGYARCRRHSNMVHLYVVKVAPDYLKNEVNAALAYIICEHYINKEGFDYVCDGQRNLRHETDYQNFLIRVLGFRRAYCKLNVIYHPLFAPIIKILYPFRKAIYRLSNKNKSLYNLYCLLYQEEIARSFKISQ